ncbi:MAG: DUF86 domain-containing protein [Desulfosarcina sp.]|nr:DUF86 domain-containing protein [Desulfobacterales bacterium]
MDSQTILNKIASLKRCVERIENKIPKTSLELQSDYDLQDIVSLNLQRAVQVCVDIAAHLNAEMSAKAPESMVESFENLSKLGIRQKERKPLGVFYFLPEPLNLICYKFIARRVLCID